MLDEMEAAGLTRALRTLPGSGGKFLREGRTVLNFSSNDYLDLAGDPRLKNAAHAAIDRYGCGATASRLMSGHLLPHAQLETALAALCGQESCLVFSSGFQANAGVLHALASPDTLILCDKLNHASIIDGARAAEARLRIYKHNDMLDLDTLLKTNTRFQNKIIVSDSLFSMDGDLAPLETLALLAEEYDAFLVIDEAHAIGVYGEGGGLCQARGVKPDVTVGTLSKALGGQGGFVACPEHIRRLLINRARSFIYSTGLAPACAASALAAVEVIRDARALGGELIARAAHFKGALEAAGLPPIASESPILPVMIGGNEAVMRIAGRLWERDILVMGVRPPTVPKDTARLRLSVTLAHSRDDLERAAEEIASVVRA